jgi:hypothetical protein
MNDGKTIRFTPRMGQDENVRAPEGVGEKPINPALALLPITPIPFEGPYALYAWGRLILYGGLAAMLYEKKKTAAYVLAGAAGLSVLTSLAYQATKK